jgi:hypothetical protein
MINIGPTATSIRPNEKTDRSATDPEVEATEIIFVKLSRLCQLSSHSRGFLARPLIFKFTGPSLWIAWGEGDGCLKVIFDKTAFV